MAFGTHWEWRGFGKLSGVLGGEIRSLRALFPESQVVTDRYIWSAGCDINFKLRLGDFKIKRCLEVAESGIARWSEDPAENYSFPLAAEVFNELVEALGCVGEPAVEPVATEQDLLDRLGAGGSDLKVVVVEKERWQYRAPILEDGIIELAQISSPEETVSVSVEHESAAGIQEIMKATGLPGGLKSLSYLDALEIWGKGGTFCG